MLRLYCFILLVHQLRHKLIGDQREHQDKSKKLKNIGLMMIVEDTESNCEYFSGGDDKRREMLFELFDHAIDEHLSDCAQNTHDQHVQDEDLVLEEELKDVNDFQ